MVIFISTYILSQLEIQQSKWIKERYCEEHRTSFRNSYLSIIKKIQMYSKIDKSESFRIVMLSILKQPGGKKYKTFLSFVFTVTRLIQNLQHDNSKTFRFVYLTVLLEFVYEASKINVIVSVTAANINSWNGESVQPIFSII